MLTSTVDVVHGSPEEDASHTFRWELDLTKCHNRVLSLYTTLLVNMAAHSLKN